MTTQDIFSGDEAVARLKQLPPDIQKLIYSADMTRIIQKIGEAHHLHIDQIGRLESETSFLMLGFTDQKDFVHVLADHIPCTPEVATEIAAQVHDELLVKIRESLHRLYPENMDPVTGQPAVKAPLAERLALKAEPVIPHITPSIPPAPAPAAVAPPAPVAQPAPVVQTPPPAQKSAFAPIDEALHTTQLSSTQSTEVKEIPAKPRPKEYGADPYLEPIE